MLTIGRLIELALGPEEARHVDTSIPQHVFDGMTQAARDNIAGWYYAPEVRVLGRLLTKEECWKEILHKVNGGSMIVTMGDRELWGPTVAAWICFREHVERGDILIERRPHAEPLDGVSRDEGRNRKSDEGAV